MIDDGREKFIEITAPIVDAYEDVEELAQGVGDYIREIGFSEDEFGTPDIEIEIEREPDSVVFAREKGETKKADKEGVETLIEVGEIDSRILEKKIQEHLERLNLIEDELVSDPLDSEDRKEVYYSLKTETLLSLFSSANNLDLPEEFTQLVTDKRQVELDTVDLLNRISDLENELESLPEKQEKAKAKRKKTNLINDPSIFVAGVMDLSMGIAFLAADSFASGFMEIQESMDIEAKYGEVLEYEYRETQIERNILPALRKELSLIGSSYSHVNTDSVKKIEKKLYKKYGSLYDKYEEFEKMFE